jgi:hypothetical protein
MKGRGADYGKGLRVVEHLVEILGGRDVGGR